MKTKKGVSQVEKLLDRAGVAEYLGVNVKAAGALMRGMTCVQIGKRLRVTEGALAAWLAENERRPDAAPAARKRKTIQTQAVPPGMYRAEDGTLKFYRRK